MPRGAGVGVTPVDKIPHARASLGEHLENVPVGTLHRVEHLFDKLPRHFLVEEVAHGVDENHPRFAPLKGLLKALRAQRQVEAALEGMAGHTAESFGEPLGVAAIAPGADLRAARHRVPRRVGPFDLGHISPEQIIAGPDLSPAMRQEQVKVFPIPE